MVHVQDDQVFLEDLDSVNGTRLNSCSLPAYQSQELRSGDVVELGSLQFTVAISGTCGNCTED